MRQCANQTWCQNKRQNIALTVDTRKLPDYKNEPNPVAQKIEHTKVPEDAKLNKFRAKLKHRPRQGLRVPERFHKVAESLVQQGSTTP